VTVVADGVSLAVTDGVPLAVTEGVPLAVADALETSDAFPRNSINASSINVIAPNFLARSATSPSLADVGFFVDTGIFLDFVSVVTIFANAGVLGVLESESSPLATSLSYTVL